MSLFYIAKAEAVAQQITENGGKAIAIPGDMLNAKYIDELVKKAAVFGEGKIHIIVNNAGFTWDGVIHKVRSSPLFRPFRDQRARAPSGYEIGVCG